MNTMPLEWAPGEAATVHRRRNAKPAGELRNRHAGEPGKWSCSYVRSSSSLRIWYLLRLGLQCSARTQNRSLQPSS